MTRPASSAVAAALASVRIAFATRPSRPITRPRSSVGDPDLEHDAVVLLDLVDADRVGIGDERADDELDEVAHSGR